MQISLGSKETGEAGGQVLSASVLMGASKAAGSPHCSTHRQLHPHDAPSWPGSSMLPGLTLLFANSQPITCPWSRPLRSFWIQRSWWFMLRLPAVAQIRAHTQCINQPNQLTGCQSQRLVQVPALPQDPGMTPGEFLHGPASPLPSTHSSGLCAWGAGCQDKGFRD